MKEVNSIDFNGKKIRKPLFSGPGLLFFGKSGCPWCQMATPAFETFSDMKGYTGYKIDAYNNEHIFDLFEIQTVPDFRYVNRNGEVTTKYEGDRTADDFYSFVKREHIKEKPIKKGRSRRRSRSRQRKRMRKTRRRK